MNGMQRRFGRRDVATMAAAATVLPGTALSLTDAPMRPAVALAQPGTPTPLTAESMVHVSGYGAVRVPPDMASAVIGIEIERPSLAEAQEEATAQATAIIDAIKAAGVAEDDIRTTTFNVRVVREKGDREEERGQRGEMRGFQVSNAVEVTVRAIDTLGRLLDDVIAAGANEVRQIAFSLSDPAEAAAQARTRAVEDARAKADGLVAAAGMTVSRVVTISEFLSPSPAAPLRLSANGGTAIADASGGDVPIAIGADEIVVEIEVTYELS